MEQRTKYVVSGGFIGFFFVACVCAWLINLNRQEQLQWEENLTEEKISHVQKIRESLYKSKPGDFVIMKNGTIMYIVRKNGLEDIRYQEHISYPEGRFMFGSLKDRVIYDVEKIIPQSSKQYDFLAGQFLRRKG